MISCCMILSRLVQPNNSLYLAWILMLTFLAGHLPWKCCNRERLLLTLVCMKTVCFHLEDDLCDDEPLEIPKCLLVRHIEGHFENDVKRTWVQIYLYPEFPLLFSVKLKWFYWCWETCHLSFSVHIYDTLCTICHYISFPICWLWCLIKLRTSCLIYGFSNNDFFLNMSNFRCLMKEQTSWWLSSKEMDFGMANNECYN